MFSRLHWRNPFNRASSVLHAIAKTDLPLTPPDSDVEEQPPSLDKRLLSEDSIYSMVFLSHTTADEPFILRAILPAVEPFFGQVFMMNIGMAGQSDSAPQIVQAYKKRIVSALSRSGWVVVVLSASAIASKWVGFEFSWSLRHKEHRRILVLIPDMEDARALLPVLRFTQLVPITGVLPSNERAIARALRRAGARTRV